MNHIPAKLEKDFREYLDTLPYKIKNYRILFVGPERPDGATREEIIYSSEYPILLSFKFYENGIQLWCLVGVKV